MENRVIARLLREQARHLEAEETTLFRVRAYRRAADVVERLERSLEVIYHDQGRTGLEELPGIGRHLSYTLEGLLTTGEFRTLRPEGAHHEPDQQLTSLPGIGAQLALRLREHLGVTSLEELEQAAQTGRLAEVGIGPRRQQILLDALSEQRQPVAPLAGEPGVAELLRLDEVYRQQARHQRLPLPGENAGNGWSYRVHYARLALAHRVHQTRDWVEIYFTAGAHQGQRLVVTETRGDLAGKRVVRGRERECRAHYQSSQPALTA